MRTETESKKICDSLMKGGVEEHMVTCSGTLLTLPFVTERKEKILCRGSIESGVRPARKAEPLPSPLASFPVHRFLGSNRGRGRGRQPECATLGGRPKILKTQHFPGTGAPV